MGWKRDRDKVRRHMDEAKAFFEVARGDQPAHVEDLLGRPFLPPEGPPERYPQEALTTSPGDDRSDILFQLQELAHLFETGALTHEEFSAAKARILGGG